MRKPSLKLSSLFAVLGLTILSSCYKEKEEFPTRSAMIVGSWRTTGSGNDKNMNGVWDLNEQNNLDSSDLSVLTFNANGTGTANATYSTISLELSWELLNSDYDLRILQQFNATTDTTTYNIVRFTKTELIVRDTFQTPSVYLAFRKM